MRREFLINIVFLVTINLLIKPVYIFGIDRNIQNVVGADSYGLYFALFNFTLLLQIINDFGIQNFNNRAISQHRQLLVKYFPNILTLKLGLGLIYFIFVPLTAWMTGYTISIFKLLLILALAQFLSSMVFYLRSNISGLGYYRTDSILSAMDKLILVLVCGFLLWSPWTKGKFQIEWLVYAQAGALGFTALLALIILRKHLPKIRWKWRPVFLWYLLKKSYPFALVIFLMTMYTRVDAVMIERMLPDGQQEAGVYASAYRLLDATNMVGFLFAGLLLPMFSRMLGKNESVRSLLDMSFQLIMAGAVSFGIGCYFFKEEIMYLLYVEATPYWGLVLGYLMLTFIAVSGTYIYGTLLTAAGKLRKMNQVFLVSILLNVGLNLVLIPNLKAGGAAVATLATQGFVLIMQILLVHRELKWSFLPLQWLRLVGFALLLWVFGAWWEPLEGFNWIVKFFLFVFGGLCLAFLFQLIRPKQLLSLLRAEP